MPFEGLSSKLQETFKKLKGKGKLNEKDIKSAMREIKLALLEADVNYKVVKDFINSTSEKCLGKEVLESLTPGHQVVKVVNDELVSLMGSTDSNLDLPQNSVAVIMLIGLQGAGKTTMAGKLSVALKKKGKRVLLTACDVYRPAAIKQLQVVGKSIDVPVFSMGNEVNPADIASASIEHAKKNNFNVVIIDTAGRLQIDEKLMGELVNMKEKISPHEILLVVDAMSGQEAVNVAQSFNDALDITGVILTKLDGDTRGGAALSIKAVTNKPIKFIGTGEKLSDLEVFHPDRMASRILGMGDIVSLVEKVQQEVDEKQAKQLGTKMLKQEFDFQDFLDSMSQIKKLGPMSKLLEMIPGFNSNALKNVDLSSSEKELKKYETIIYSMTLKERQNPPLVSASPSRKKRIAKGAGVTIIDVNKLLKQFVMMKKMMKQFNGQKFIKKGLTNRFPLFKN